MFITFESRSSNSPIVERVWRSRSERADVFHSMASGFWGMVVTRLQGRTTLTIRGPETQATTADCPADGEWVGVCFRPGSFLSLIPAELLRDRNDVTLPEASRRAFWLGGSAWCYPDFENMETFVDRLIRRGLIQVDPLVQAVIQGTAKRFSPRTEQRRFLRATGMTHASLRQIERARHAAFLLCNGASIAEAANRTGYFDQAHLTRALKRFVGRTPAQILRGEGQLSLLYNPSLP
jgi:AraC-like DNA-binding protein